MVKGSNTFVFVVCGADPYIDCLNFAIRALRPRTQCDILVITDTRRNESKIACDHIIDIATPTEMNHHQASIFLKTSIHRYVDLEKGRYCYLDSDIVAISKNVDDVFSIAREPISFCADNMELDLFSPYSINCCCYEKARKDEEALNKAQAEYAVIKADWNAFLERSGGSVLNNILIETRKHYLRNIFTLGRFAIGKVWPFGKTLRFKKYVYHKQKKSWFNADGEEILYPIESYNAFVSRKTGFRYNGSAGYWYDHQLQDVCIPCCSHLHEQIRNEYGIRIHPDQWQHWNGGVFVFDKRSVDFLEIWHEETMRKFNDPRWKTRDQGTLALTVWKFGLQNMELLPSRFNYIIDDFKDGLLYDEENGISRDHGQSWDHPDFLHVYHRFGDEGWAFWQHLKSYYLNNNE